MKILVSDFDGTILLSEEETMKNKKAIDKFRNNGNLLVIATGRNLSYLLEDINRFKISFDYLICNDGAMIYDNKLRCLKEYNIFPNVIDAILKIIVHSPTELEWYLDTGKNYTKNPNKKINKIIIKVQNLEYSKQLLNEIENQIPEIHGYISNHWINLVSKEVNKSIGIKKLIEIENLSKYFCYTVGNDINDIEMLQDFNGYIVKNIYKELPSEIMQTKSVSDLICQITKESD